MTRRRNLSEEYEARKTRGGKKSPSISNDASNNRSMSRFRRSHSSEKSRSRWYSRRRSSFRQSNSSSRFKRDKSTQHGTLSNKNRGSYWKRRSRSSSWSSTRYRETTSTSRRRRNLRSSRSPSSRISHGRNRNECSTWRGRRRHDNDSLSCKLDHYKDSINTSVIVLRRVPSTLTEDDLERAIRLTAISLGFSPPNFIKLLPLSDTPAADATTSAYVQFPSNDSAQVFYDACRKDFQVKNKRIRLELPECPAARLALLSSSHSSQEWGLVIDSANYPGCLGPGIPLPNLEEFVMDSKSGLLFNEKAGLFYDMTNQQFVSFNGVYYARSLTSPDTLIPIRELPGAAHVGASSFLTTKAKILNESLEAQEKKQAESKAAEVVLVAPVDSAVTKATAVASVLAAAQLAAKATQRVAKPKITESQSQSILETQSQPDGQSGFLRSHKKESNEQILTIESVFGEGTLEDDIRNEIGIEQGNEDQENSKQEQKSTITQTAPVNLKSQSVEQFICFVCIQQFQDAYHLSKHQTESLLHQVSIFSQNIKPLCIHCRKTVNFKGFKEL